METQFNQLKESYPLARKERLRKRLQEIEEPKQTNSPAVFGIMGGLAILFLVVVGGISFIEKGAVVPLDTASQNQPDTLLLNGDFSAANLRPWRLHINEQLIVWNETERYVTAAEQACIHFNDGGTEQWFTRLVQENIPLVEGQRYHLQFEAQAQIPVAIRAVVFQDSTEWNAYQKEDWSLTTTWQMYTTTFTHDQPTDPQASFRLQFGGNDPIENIVCIDNVSLLLVQ